MDTLTHIVTGAAIGQLTLGRRAGTAAACWGGAIALVPDLDVALGAWLGDTAALTLHRGFTHSLLFAALTAVTAGILLARLHRQREPAAMAWGLLAGLVLLSHLALDTFTSYGIQLLWPVSESRFAIASISVIDPVLTLPLLLTVAAALLLKQSSPWPRPLAWTGLGLASLYLATTLVNKAHVSDRFKTGLEQAGIESERLFVKPTMFNNLLWRGIAEVDDGYHVGFYSLLDGTAPDRFYYFPRRRHLLPAPDAPVVRDLVAVSRGFYQLETREGETYFNDLRYGQAFEWLEDNRPHVFSHRLADFDRQGRPRAIETIGLEPDRERDRATFRALVHRALGRGQ